MPEDEGRPVRQPAEPVPTKTIPDIDVNRSGPLIGGRALRPRKRKVRLHMEPSSSSRDAS